MKNKIIVAVGVFAILFGGAYLAMGVGNSAQVEDNPEARVLVGQTTYDWGEIEMSDGEVEKEFEIKNEGTEALTLSNVSTSCMCTTAQLSFGDATSPAFGMHTKSPYVMEVPPQETARLRVVFDPAFHGPGGVGPISRQVSVATNDPSNPKLDFALTAMVK